MNPYDHSLLRFTCHFCGIELEVPVELGGETAPCPACGLMITAPVTHEAGPLDPDPVVEENQAHWNPALPPQRASERAPDPDAVAPVVGFGQLITAQSRGSPLQAGVRERPPIASAAGGRRSMFFPVSATLLGLAIVGLSGVLLWRSELWRAGRGGTFAMNSRNEAREDHNAEEGVSNALQQAENEFRGLVAAASPVWSPALEASEKEDEQKTTASAAAGQPASPPAASASAPEPAAEQRVIPPVAEEEKPVPGAVVASEAAGGAVDEGPEAGAAEQVAMADSSAKVAEVQPAEEDEVVGPAPDKAPAAPVPEAAGVIPVAGITPGEAGASAVALKETAAGSSAPATALDRAREVIRRFLEAERWQERVPFIFDGEAKQAALREYFQNHPDRAVTNYRLDFFHNELGEEGELSMFVFFLTLDQEEEGFPLIVKSDHAGTRIGIDWDLHVEFKDRHFAQFVEKKEEAAREFHVVIQRVTYWEEDRDQIPGIEELVCYKIDPPYPGFTQYAFVEKASEEGKRMVEGLSWETDPLAAKVRMNWAKFPSGRPYMRVTELVARSWAE